MLPHTPSAAPSAAVWLTIWLSVCVADSDVTVFIYRQLQDRHRSGDIIFINLDIIKIFSYNKLFFKPSYNFHKSRYIFTDLSNLDTDTMWYYDSVTNSLSLSPSAHCACFTLHSMIIINFVPRLSLCVLTPSLPLVIFSSHYHTNVTIIIII